MKNIVWCIDPNDSVICKDEIVKALKAFTIGMSHVKITPLYVLSSKSTQLSRFTQTSIVEKLLPWANKQLENFMLNYKSCGLQFNEPVVIFNSKHSARHDVLTAVEFSEKLNAETIFCTAHSKKPWTLGSFTETLVLKSKIPIFLIQPKSKSFEQFENIMFPTDFSSSSKNALEALAPVVKKWGAQIHLVHQMLSPIDPIVDSGVLTMGGGWTSPEKYTESIKDYSQQELNSMQAICNKHNVECSSHLLESSSFFTQDIIDFADEKDMQLMVLSSTADDLLSVIVGSNCRELIRSSKIPVWIQHVQKD